MDVSSVALEQREQIVSMVNSIAVISEVVNQIAVQLNDLFLAVMRSENIPVASHVKTAETQSSVGTFSSRML